jgi:hypothetical protein
MFHLEVNVYEKLLLLYGVFVFDATMKNDYLVEMKDI